MSEHDEQSGVNTILLVGILVIAVAAAVWFFTQYQEAAPAAATTSVELQLPATETSE